MKLLGKSVEEFLRRDGRRKSELAATCGLLPSAITKVIQGESYSPDMVGRIIRGFDSKSRRAALLSAYLEEVAEQTKLEGGLVVVQPAGEYTFNFPVPPHLREVLPYWAGNAFRTLDWSKPSTIWLLVLGTTSPARRFWPKMMNSWAGFGFLPFYFKWRQGISLPGTTAITLAAGVPGLGLVSAEKIKAQVSRA